MKKKFGVFLLGALSMIFIGGCSLIGKEDDEDEEKRPEVSISDDRESEDSDGSDLFEDPSVNKKIDEINAYIDRYFYFDIDEEKREEALYDSIMLGLDDPYSVYYTKEEYADLMEDSSGEYVGVGAVVTQDANMQITIVRPIPGSPAEEVGLMAGDIIVQVGDVEITDQELSLVVDMIRGEEGTKAYIKVYRESEGKYLEFNVPRRLVENVSVNTKMLENNIGYIQVTQFYENTADEFETAIDEMQAAKVDGIIIDLRDNPGGVLTAVVDMCDYTMDESIIVTTKDRDDNIIQQYKSDAEHAVDLPMVVLVNGNSASASEIFAGAMKDSGKAVIVGTQTFGKGIVQSIIPLSDGTAIKITMAKYFTPNGSDIHTLGIEPDYVVELADGRENAVNLSYEEDLQLQKAEEIIKGMIK